MLAKEKSESTIQSEILNYLFLKGLVFRYNNTPVFDPKLKRFRKINAKFQPYGLSDIFFFQNNISYAIEVKKVSEYKYLMKNYDDIRNGFYSHKSKNSTEKKKARLQSQILFLEDFREHSGGVGEFVCSLEMVLSIIKSHH